MMNQLTNLENPFIKVEWEDTFENLTQERIKRVKEYFKKKYNSTDVKIVTKLLSNNSNTKLKSLEVSDNILDPQYQKKLIKDYIDENKIDIKWDMIDRLDNRVNNELTLTDKNKVKYNKWFIEKIEFSNFLSYGDDNVIDFASLDGISLIESHPGNFAGKTTIGVDLLMFMFFNSTTKTKTNIEIFNKFRDADEVKVKGYVIIDGERYIIERKIIRKKTKAGEYNVKNELEFYKIFENGDIVNLAGEQRRETETFITSAIGTEEDFLMTILTTGRNLEEMIDSKPTARGQVLTRFLGLDSLGEKETKCKEIYNEWSKKLISNTYNVVQLETDNDENQKSIISSENEIKILEEILNNLGIKLKENESRKDVLLQSKYNDIDRELINTNPILLKREVDEIIKKQLSSKSILETIKVIEPDKYYMEDDHTQLKAKLNDLIVNDKINLDDIKRYEKLVYDLEFGSICPTCKRSLSDVDHTNEINEIKDTINKLKVSSEENKSKISDLRDKDQTFIDLKRVYDEYERNKLRKEKTQLEIDQMDLEINKNQSKLDNYEKNKQKLEDNKKIDSEIITIKTHIETINADIRVSNLNIEKHKNNNINLSEKIKTNIELIKKIKSEEELVSVFKIYLSIFGKNGISKMIMKNMIPLLNQELHRILVDSCYFTLELNVNDKNEVEFLMIDNETRVVKPINSGSGYEKTISSLSIRSVLTKICTLPKPNIVVMDEVFGKVADENLDLVGEFFKKIKNYFEHILVISHNPLIRNWSDNIIIIKKDDNVSSIEEIITKIS